MGPIDSRGQLATGGAGGSALGRVDDDSNDRSEKDRLGRTRTCTRIRTSTQLECRHDMGAGTQGRASAVVAVAAAKGQLA